uniref:Serine protease 12 n=1 Tax=Sinocyclocheilus grahami TaxID=75366 RepID=A0A672S8C5_SINGR
MSKESSNNKPPRVNNTLMFNSWTLCAFTGSLRLQGAYEGRVEVYHAGQWGTVCDDQWDDNDAEVVCRQLGGIAKAWVGAYYGAGSGRVLLDEVSCTGNELSIEQCPKTAWGEHNCDHTEDAGVSCIPLTGSLQRSVGDRV